MKHSCMISWVHSSKSDGVVTVFLHILLNSRCRKVCFSKPSDMAISLHGISHNSDFITDITGRSNGRIWTSISLHAGSKACTPSSEYVQLCKVRWGYSDSGIIPTICNSAAIFLPRQGSAELLWYHRIPPSCFEFELQCCKDKFAEHNWFDIVYINWVLLYYGNWYHYAVSFLWYMCLSLHAQL